MPVSRITMAAMKNRGKGVDGNGTLKQIYMYVSEAPMDIRLHGCAIEIMSQATPRGVGVVTKP